jgi:hypothetical protein
MCQLCQKFGVCWVKCSVAEVHTASVFSVTELLQADAEVLHNKKCVGYIRSLECIWLITVPEYKNRHLMNIQTLTSIQTQPIIITYYMILLTLVTSATCFSILIHHHQAVNPLVLEFSFKF